MNNKLVLLICILYGSCVNNEISVYPPETTNAKISRQRVSVLDKLREHSEEELEWKRRFEIFQVFVNEENQIFVGKELIELDELKVIGKAFFHNYRKVSNSRFADNAMISLRSEKKTPYKFYLSVYNELRQIYSELWEEEAQNTYKTSFDALKLKEKEIVRKKIPLSISESEPTEF